MIKESYVTVYKGECTAYPSVAPFHPDEVYPEYEFEEVGPEANGAYQSVRSCFRTAGLDADKFGTPQWNPMRSLIRPGETVLLKPNLIRELHPRDRFGWQYILTHGSVIRAVADYVCKAVGREGKIVIADAPQTDSSFEKIVSILGLDIIRDLLRARGFQCELRDLRREQWVNKGGVIVSREALPGDPEGNIAFDLGNSSEFKDHSGSGRYYGADYDTEEVNRHHMDGRHEYLIAGSALHCDVVFSLPKLKTHKKAGITVTLKNLVGINGDKNWLPHHTEGDSSSGGDEHPAPGTKHRLERRLAALFRKISLNQPVWGPWSHRIARRVGRHVFGDTEDVIRSGNWWGNDTAWRMCLDLNKIIAYGNTDGTLRVPPSGRRRHYSLVDAIVAGEGRGPMNPDPVAAGVVVFGLNAPSVDSVCAVLMGYDPEKIPLVRQSFRCRDYPLAEWNWPDVQLISNRPEWNALLRDLSDQSTFAFEPHFGWKGKIERKTRG